VKRRVRRRKRGERSVEFETSTHSSPFKKREKQKTIGKSHV